MNTARTTLLALQRIMKSVIMALSLLPAALIAEAQPQPTPGLLGILAPTTTRLPQYRALRSALHDLGYEEGRNLVIEERAAEEKADRIPAFAADLVRRHVNVILAAGPEATLQAARKATSTLPIVMVAIDYDPVALGYIASLGRPGGNITGVFLQQLELTPKRLELLREAIPGLSQVAVLWDGFSADQWRLLQGSARSMGIQVQSLELRDPPYDYERAFQAASRGGARALLVLMSPVFFADRARIADLTAKHRIPAMFGLREWADSGGLMSYGANISDMFVRAAAYIDKIMKGANPAELPVEQPTKFELVVNRKTAKSLGLTIPASFLLRADRVID